MNPIYKLSILLISLTGFISCSKQLDINDDPNNLTDVPIKLLVPSQQVQLTYTLAGEAGRITGSLSQHFAGHRNIPLQYAIYDIRPAALDAVWSSFYAYVLRDLKAITDKGRVTGDSMYVGLAQIMMAQAFSNLTDFYGDIPFTDALQDEANITPRYDKQENIYPALIKMIDAGIANVKSGKGLQPGLEDLIYGAYGDDWAELWEKYGNSLKLRLLNHQSKRNPGAAAAFLATNPPLISSNEENAKVIYGGTSANANPIYGFDQLAGLKDNALSSTFIEKLQALADPRITEYAFPVAYDDAGREGQYFGNIPGGDEDDASESLYSREGAAYASISSAVPLITYSEVQFIIAEVKLRSADITGAKTAYEKAITADFTSLDIPLSGYLAKPQVLFNNTLQRIIEQKWLTLIHSPYEAWTDWRRARKDKR